MVEIQVQDSNGYWKTYCVTQNSEQLIRMEMESLQRQFPNYRIRAVDEVGRLVDIL